MDENDTTKYVIYATIKADGVITNPPIIMAINENNLFDVISDLFFFFPFVQDEYHR